INKRNMKTHLNARTPRRRGAKAEAKVDLTREASQLVVPVASVLWFRFPQNPCVFASLRLCVKEVAGTIYFARRSFAAALLLTIASSALADVRYVDVN